MKYKALMLDMDGTVIRYGAELPTKKVAEAIKKAQEKVEMCIVTGRSYRTLAPILEYLELRSGYAVVSVGAQLIDLSTKKVLFEQTINLADANFIVKTIRESGMAVYVRDEIYKRMNDGHFLEDSVTRPALNIFIDDDYSSEKIDEVKDKLRSVTDVAIYKTQHRKRGYFGLDIVHINATKLQGVEKFMKLTGYKSEELIGAGDSYNDFPLLMACGTKVAMGNAIEDLKAIADYVAPSVDEDGVADIIEKYIINS